MELQKRLSEDIKKLQDLAANLQPNNLAELTKQLRELRHFAHDFEYFTDQRLREQIENAAEEKVRRMLEAGITFEAVEIDNVHFYMDGSGDLVKGIKPGDIPF